MKKVLSLGLVIGFICFSAIVSFAAEMKCEEAANHIGEKATVCGKIVDTMPYQGITILGMGKAVMDQGAVGIEIPDSMKDKLPEDMYVGKEICVTGEIYKNPSGGGSIKVTDPSQIKAK
ncbi:MAG: hypothetical protein PVG39_05730 [Desulfobacteraceae bacterium]|jgi:hypothetical protein